MPSPDAMQPFVAELADLYRLAGSTTLDDFPDAVLDRLGRWIPFDGAVFGFGQHAARSLRIATASVYRRDPAILEEYATVSHADPVTAAFLQGPSHPIAVDARAVYAARRHGAIAHFAARHDLRHLLLFGDRTRAAGPLRWIVLYRGHDDAFDDASSERLWAAWQHISCALDLNRAQALDRHEARHSARALALVDASGTLEAVDPHFRALLGREWAQADGITLPAPARAAMAAGTSFRGREIELAFCRLGAHAVAHARLRAPATRLSARERIVAEHFAAGRSHKEVARALGVSPNTVRAQLAQVYRKLGVRDKATLAVRLLRGAD